MPTKRMLAVACVSILGPVMADGGKDDGKGVPSVQESRRHSLKAMSAVYTVIGPLGRDSEKVGLSVNQLRTDLELRLRSAGVPVITEKEGLERSGNTYLHLDVRHLTNEAGFCAYSVRLAFIQNVFPQRNPSRLLRASTWAVSTSGYVSGTGVSTIRQAVRDFADRFCNGYLAVNQKDSTGKPLASDFKYAGPHEACKRWGKPENYIEQFIWDYNKLRMHFSEAEVRLAARQACKERVTNEAELVDCRACMEEIITGLYKDEEGL